LSIPELRETEATSNPHQASNLYPARPRYYDRNWRVELGYSVWHKSKRLGMVEGHACGSSEQHSPNLKMRLVYSKHILLWLWHQFLGCTNGHSGQGPTIHRIGRKRCLPWLSPFRLLWLAIASDHKALHWLGNRLRQRYLDINWLPCLSCTLFLIVIIVIFISLIISKWTGTWLLNDLGSDWAGIQMVSEGRVTRQSPRFCGYGGWLEELFSTWAVDGWTTTSLKAGKLFEQVPLVSRRTVAAEV